MTGWRIDPAGVQGVLSAVEEQAEALGEVLSESAFQGVLDGLASGGVLTQDVPGAVNAVISDQLSNLTNISNRINAGVVGVANAVIAYRNGQEEMAGTYQTELLRSAESGDFTFFVDHGQQG
jgi:hypothetical protein